MSISTLPFKHPLPYVADSAVVFSIIADQPWAVFLDSGFPHAQQGRYDILACKPCCTLLTYGDSTQIHSDAGSIDSTDDPFQLLKQQLALFAVTSSDLPFSGGAIGYFGYDLARRIERLPSLALDEEAIPDLAVGIYRWAVVVDHQAQQTWLAGSGLNASEQQNWLQRFSTTAATDVERSFRVLYAPQSNLSKAAYGDAFNRIQQYLKEGDCYQVNLTQRFVSGCEGDPWWAYQTLRQLNPAPFSAYLNVPGVQVLSSSPERFLQLRAGRVETKPIKGTRPRKGDAAADVAEQQALQGSKKDRAENVMIVDLLRNDLGKCCQAGSVAVPALFAIESYATVHHLVSTVTGQLAPDQQAIDLLRSCFPGGSITGAPKIRAMEIIEELEPHRRGLYCGSIGYIGFNGDMDTNIAIRTLVHSQGQIRFWVGGGIVTDSEVDAEYQECFDKAAALLQLLAHFTV